MKALVTGGGGFLGRYIVRGLLERGDTVVVLGRGEYPDLKKMGVKVFRGDIRDGPTVDTAVAGVDTIFHVASRVGVFGPQWDFFGTNVTGTKNILFAAKRHGVGRVVYTSSPSVVFDGSAHEMVDESVPYPTRYLAHYPHTKAIAEREILEANGKLGLLTCSLRPHLIWGPGDTNLIPRLIERADSGRLKIVGDGKNIIDTVYVENAANAHIQAADSLVEGSSVCGSAYFITQGELVNCWDWINQILDRLGKPPVTARVPYKLAYLAGGALEIVYGVLKKTSEPPMTRFLAQQLSMSHWFSIEKAKKDFGYDPKIKMSEGMDRLIASLKT